MTESTRPKRVVIVDAENPMEEIHGEFFWREDHEQLLDEARDAAFSDGYTRGWTEGSRVTFRIRRRPRHVVLRALFLLAAGAFAVSLIANFAH